MIDAVITILAEHGLQLLCGATAILGIGCLAMAMSKVPIHRQRLAELSVAGFGLWILVVLVPMPRLIDWQARQDDGELTAASLPQRVEVAEPVPVMQPRLRPAPSVATSVPLASIASPSPSPMPIQDRQIEPPPQRSYDVGSWLAMLFLGGSMLMMVCLALGAGLLAVQLSRSRPAPVWLRHLGRRLSQEFAVMIRVRIRISARPTRPFCFGLRGGTIVLPMDICERGKQAQLCQVLRHEIVHLRQRDTLGQLLFAFALPLLFFHPLYWWLRRQSRLAAELIADDQAARQSDRVSYARELINLSQTNLPGPAGLLPAMPAIASKTQFYRRMTMLLQREDDLATRCTKLRKRVQFSLAGLLIACGASLWGVEPLAAQDPSSRTAKRMQRELNRRAEQIDRLQAQVETLQRQVMLLLETQTPAEIELAEIELSPASELVEFDVVEIELAPEVELAEIDVVEIEFAPELAEIEVPEEVDEDDEGDRDEDAERRLREFAQLDRAIVADSITEPTSSATQLQESAAILELLLHQIDLSAQERGAMSRLSEVELLVAQKLVNKSELRTLRLEIESTGRKMGLLRRLLEMETKACEMDIGSLALKLGRELKRGRNPMAVEAELLRARARLELLKSAR